MENDIGYNGQDMDMNIDYELNLGSSGYTPPPHIHMSSPLPSMDIF